jgi:hypothetical protein
MASPAGRPRKSGMPPERVRPLVDTLGPDGPSFPSSLTGVPVSGNSGLVRPPEGPAPIPFTAVASLAKCTLDRSQPPG